MKKILPTLFVATTLIMGCNDKKEKVLTLEKEVLNIHDQIMPRVGEISSLKAKLNQRLRQLDSLENEGISGNNLAQDRERMMSIGKKLDLADSLMMDWMYQFKGDSAKNLKADKAISYFENQKQKILNVKTVSIESIEAAKTILE